MASVDSKLSYAISIKSCYGIHEKPFRFESRSSCPKTFNPVVHHSKVLLEQQAALLEIAFVDGRLLYAVNIRSCLSICEKPFNFECRSSLPKSLNPPFRGFA